MPVTEMPQKNHREGDETARNEREHRSSVRAPFKMQTSVSGDGPLANRGETM